MTENHQPTSLIIDDTTYETTLNEKYKQRRKYEPENPKQIRAYIPGVIKAIFVKEGQAVKEGEEVLILEAMKMENRLLCPIGGNIKQILIEVNQMVTKNQLLVEIE